jgi:hypothetical protein
MNTDNKQETYPSRARLDLDKSPFEPGRWNRSLELVRSAASTGTLLFLALGFLTLLFSRLPHSIFNAASQDPRHFATKVAERKRLSNVHFGCEQPPIRIVMIEE